MEQLDQIITIISLTMGVAWASGINLYATLLTLGILANTGHLELPPNLMIVADPLVIVAAGLMYLVEFFADKTPGVDTGWDAIHTFIRIPAGAALAAGAIGDVNPAVALAAALVGGSLTAGTHATKAGARVMINTSPEPVSNWAVSLAEDFAVVGGLLVSLNYPWLFLILIALFVLLMIWALPKIWRGIRTIFSYIARLFGAGKKKSTEGSELRATNSQLEPDKRGK